MAYQLLKLDWKQPDRSFLEKKRRLLAMSTKELMIGLNVARAYGEWDHGFMYNFAEIKEELDKRPHIPNKKEGEKIRIEKQKTRPERKVRSFRTQRR